ncbi:hypothetical protein Tco_0124376, partial [Tanacetum coccineum]
AAVQASLPRGGGADGQLMQVRGRLTNEEATRGHNDKNGSCQAMDPDASRRELAHVKRLKCPWAQ